MLLQLWFLCLPCVLFAADKCNFKQSNLNLSSALDSLQCYNDFESYFHCTWKEEPEIYSNRTLTLLFQRDQDEEGKRGECKNSSNMNGTKECRYTTNTFTTSTTYKAFFDYSLKLCSSNQSTPQNLSQLLRAQTPDNVTTSSTEDRGRQITWSSPYPQSPALNDDIAYQVNYRPHGGDNWTTEELSDTQMKLEKKNLIPGHEYEAKVRARVRLGHWSHWSPIVSWHTPLDLEQAPRVDCVLEGEREVRCSWEQSVELGHFITYQLLCRPNHTATPQECCKDPPVTQRHGEDTINLSCALNLPQSSTSTLLMELVPMRNAKVFSPMKHIRPYPPTQVNVREKGVNWVVEWTPVKIKDNPSLIYEVRYYSLDDKEDTGSTSTTNLDANIPMSLLVPSRRYQVQVRSRMNSPFDGPPSEWSSPVEWTSQAVTGNSWIYALAAVVVAVIFFTIFIVPTCRKRVALWVESVPSPYKSKIILEIQVGQNPEVIVCEETYLCKVMDMDCVSTCSTPVSLWPKKELDSQTEEADDEGIWSCDKVPVSPVDKSSMSFTGPYIFCQPVESKPMEEDVSEQAEASCPDVGCPAPVWTAQSEEGYVRLPSPTASTSMQYPLTESHCSSSSIDEQSSSHTEEDQHCPSNSSEASWPQGGAMQGSGYCQLPTDFTQMQLVQALS